MRLLGDFFEIIEQKPTERGWQIRIRLNPDHLIFTGHFPGYPVTPAAVQIQMLREVTEELLQGKLALYKLPNSKFIQVLNPLETPEFEWLISFQTLGETVKIKARAYAEDKTFCKVNSEFQIEEGK